MIVEIKVPSVGESVTEATLAEWFKKDGDTVRKDEPLFVIETDKVTLEVVAEAAGVLSIKARAGETVAIGAVVGTIDTEGAPAEMKPPDDKKPAAQIAPERPKAEKQPPKPAQKEAAKAGKKAAEKQPPREKQAPLPPPQSLAPSVRNLIAENHIDVNAISGTGPTGRITRGDVLLYLERAAEKKETDAHAVTPKPAPAEKRRQAVAEPLPSGDEQTRRQPMSPIRRRIAARLLEAKQNTAMLTTFNEIDMFHVQDIRARYKESFQQKHRVSLGLMSFFIKATIEALKAFPQVNAFIDSEEIVFHHYYHIGIAVGAEKGLVVPVIRHADKCSFAQLEQAIVGYVKKIKENRLQLADLEGGTFTITNGGVYGSLLSTPILNMPQSAILGMHKIEKRPVVVDDKIEIRPMMYVALSYDHRIIDGREAVSFLKFIKEYIENPEQMMVEM
jgi:2-oxoglutarate dehydrogenase E2 component (dihydrolipoamide succinyltransferase)